MCALLLPLIKRTTPYNLLGECPFFSLQLKMVSALVLDLNLIEFCNLLFWIEMNKFYFSPLTV